MNLWLSDSTLSWWTVLGTQLSVYELHAGYTQWGPVCLVQRIQGEGDVEETEQIFPRLTNDQVLIISSYTLGNVVKNLGFLIWLIKKYLKAIQQKFNFYCIKAPWNKQANESLLWFRLLNIWDSIVSRLLEKYSVIK